MVGYGDYTFLAGIFATSVSPIPSPVLFDDARINPGDHYNITSGIHTVPLDGTMHQAVQAVMNTFPLVRLFWWICPPEKKSGWLFPAWMHCMVHRLPASCTRGSPVIWSAQIDALPLIFRWKIDLNDIIHWQLVISKNKLSEYKISCTSSLFYRNKLNYLANNQTQTANSAEFICMG